MKPTLVALCLTAAVGFMSSCLQSEKNEPSTNYNTDSTETGSNSAYVPGVGEIMDGIIQSHHEKLWLAGSHQNWKLAEYERHQLLSGFTRIQKYHGTEPVANMVSMIYPELDTIENAIKDKDARKFNQHFELLTKTCNTCHQASGYDFNVIQIPTGHAFSNQKFF